MWNQNGTKASTASALSAATSIGTPAATSRSEGWGIELEGGEGLGAIHGLLNSKVEYRRTDAFALADIEERFDFIFCLGILHRVENPLGLLHILASRLTEGGRILIETYGVLDDENAEDGALCVPPPGTVYPNDSFVYWQFSSSALTNLAAITRSSFELHSTPLIDGHPRMRLSEIS